MELWNSLDANTKIATTAAIAAPLLYLSKKYFEGGVNKHRTDLTGKVVLVTGANAGIGLETAKYLAQLNATVYVTVRDDAKGKETVAKIKDASRNNAVDYFCVELSSLKSVRSFVSEYKKRTNNKKIDIFIQNAGVMAPPLQRTEDGFELQFGVNHLAHFLMTNLLLKDNLINENGGRVVVLSSMAHSYAPKGIQFEDPNFEKLPYNRWHAYGQSKLANIMFAKELNKRMKEQGKKIVAVALHPGIVMTELQRHIGPAWIVKPLFRLQSFFLKTPYQGAQTSLHCALSPDIVNQGGEYFSDCAIKKPLAVAEDSTQAAKLWDLSEKLVGLRA